MNGDLFMGTYIKETEHHLIIENPVTIKVITVPGKGGVIEKTITAPFCSLTEDTQFQFRHDHVQYVKPLHSNIKSYYFNLVDAFETDQSEELDISSSVTEEATAEEYETPEQEEQFVIVPDNKTYH